MKQAGFVKRAVFIKPCSSGWMLCEAATGQLHTLCRGTADSVRAALVEWVGTQKNLRLVDAPKESK